MNTTPKFNPDFVVVDGDLRHAFVVMSLSMFTALDAGAFEDAAALEFSLENGESFQLSSGETCISLEHSDAPTNVKSDVLLVKALEAFCWRYQLEHKSADEVLLDVLDGSNPKRGNMIEWLEAYVAAWDAETEELSK